MKHKYGYYKMKKYLTEHETNIIKEDILKEYQCGTHEK